MQNFFKGLPELVEEEGGLRGEELPKLSVEHFGHAVERHIVHVLVVDEESSEGELAGLD